MIDLEDFLIAWMAIFAAALFIIAFLSWRRHGHRRLLLIAAGFGCFLAKGIILALGLYLDALAPLTGVYALGIDLVILLLFYLAIFRK